MASSPSTVQSKNLLVNYVSLLGGATLAKGMGLITVLMLTRYLGVEDFGRYSLAFSVWAFLNTLVDLGGSHIAGREISRQPGKLRPVMESIIYLRLLGCLLFLPVGFALGPGLGLSKMLVLIVFIGILTGFEAYYDIYFSATMQLNKSARARFLASIANTLLIALAIMLKWPLLAIMLLAMLNPLLKLGLDYAYGGAFPIKMALPDWDWIHRIFTDGWPLWLGGLQSIVLARIDTLMLQALSPTGQHDLGIYSAAFRFSEVMALLINALCPAILPLLVQSAQHPAKIQFLAQTGLRLILTVLIAISLLIFWYAPWIAKLYGPGYAEAAGCMRILIWSQAFVAVNALCYYLLLVYNQQGKRPVILANIGMTLLNIALNALLIPSLHAEGASWATVMTEAAILLCMLGFIRAYTPLRLGKDILAMECLALFSCLPILFTNRLYGGFSALLFIGLVFTARLLTPQRLKDLALEKLPEAPRNPT